MTTLAERHGRVAGEGLDAETAAHYGDPLREQRKMARGVAVVDRSDRGLVVVSGADRLTWLHSLTTQYLEQLPDRTTIQGLILSPHGHIEQDLWFTAIGDEVWIDCEPGKAAELAAYLDSMRFMLRVEVADRSDEFAMVTVVGPQAGAVVATLAVATPTPAEVSEPDRGAGAGAGAGAGSDSEAEPGAGAGAGSDSEAEPGAGAVTDFGAGVDAGVQASADAGSRRPVVLQPGMVCGVPSSGGYLRALPYEGEYDVVGTQAQVDAATARLIAAGAEPAGQLAYDAWRVERLRPRLGRETDHRTIPHEIGLIGQAVHLHKGCYRGQETVARVHNLGRPPRRLVKLQVDGSQHTVPASGSRVFINNRDVGFVGTSVMHHEEGPVALAVIKRNVAEGAEVLIKDDEVQYAATVDHALDV